MAQRRASPPIPPHGPLAEVMRRYDEGQQVQRAEAEAHARAVLSGREQAGVPLPERTQGQVQP